jgi:DNA adenine methylase
LNRTNRSGIIFKAGPIGGFNQDGNYKVNVRFNKEDLIERVQKIALHRKNIKVTNLDAVQIINNINSFHTNINKTFLYLDPPYYKRGKELYLNNYNHDDHLLLANSVKKLRVQLDCLL